MLSDSSDFHSGVQKIKPKKVTVEKFLPTQEKAERAEQQTQTQRKRVVPHQELVSTKELLYVVKDIDQKIVRLKLLNNMAKWFDATIHIIFWATKLPSEKEFAIFEQKKSDLLHDTKWPHLKCSLYIKGSSEELLESILNENKVCALAFQSKQEQLTDYVFDASSLHEDMLVLAL